MRLIDADEAYEIAKDSGCHNDFARCMADLTSLREVLEDCETVDAVPVVRCKDCEYWMYEFDEVGLCVVDAPDTDGVERLTFDFCSCGERKTDV